MYLDKLQQHGFDFVVNHLLTQKERSYDETSSALSCAYRGIGNLSCAVGCLIADNKYDKTTESASIRRFTNDSDS